MKVSKTTAYALHAMMYMVRHTTQLPVTTGIVAKSEGIPSIYLAKIFQRLAKAGFVKAVKGRQKGYTLARSPNEISLLELLETIEGKTLFDDCFLRQCDCSGTPENCHIYACWASVTKRIRDLLEDITLETATWNHPEHRFCSLTDSLRQGRKKKIKEYPVKVKTKTL
ncbi:MAG: Rrf2 family transcriptional regulator [Phycisphaerae bacterium]|jgi:Rrf2 family protein